MALSDKIADHIFENSIKSVEELNESDFEGKKFSEFINEQIASIGENIVIRRLETLEAGDDEYITGYVHFNNANGVILKAKADKVETFEAAKQLLQNVTMHVSAMGPNYISYKELDEEFIEKELAALKGSIEVQNDELERMGRPLKYIPKYGSRAQITEEVIEEETKFIKEQLLSEGKPEHILDKIIPGKISKFIEDNTQIDSQYAL
ncbi:elongation factor Ts, partial [Rhodovulum adriaticum]|nr:elongation factor Ts [Rhodovulum adriaticum]